MLEDSTSILRPQYGAFTMLLEGSCVFLVGVGSIEGDANDDRVGYMISTTQAMIRLYLSQVPLVCQQYIVLQRNDDILICAEFEIIRYDSRVILLLISRLRYRAAHLDLVVVRPTLLQTPKIPWYISFGMLSGKLAYYNVFASRCNNGLFSLIYTSIKSIVSR